MCYTIIKIRERELLKTRKVIIMYTFEKIFEKMTREEIKSFEDDMGMSVNDFLMEAEENPFVKTVAEILLTATIDEKLDERD